MMFPTLKLLRAPRLALSLAAGLSAAAVLGTAGSALGAAGASASSFEASAVSIPIQQDVVLAHGETVIFIGCRSHTPCSGMLTVRLAPSDSLITPISNPADLRTHRRAASWLRRREASTDLLIVRHRVRLRQRRVSPVGLRLGAHALSLLAFAEGPLTFEVLMQERAHAPVEGSIVLRLASSRGRVA